MDLLGWAVILLLVGLSLAILEVFVPSGGMLGFLSVTSILAALFLAFRLPIAHVPEIGHRDIGKGQRVQVPGRPKLGGQRRHREAPALLAFPNQIPPSFVRFDVALSRTVCPTCVGACGRPWFL